MNILIVIKLVFAVQFAFTAGFSIVHLIDAQFDTKRALKLTALCLMPAIGYYYIIKWSKILIKNDLSDYC